MKFKSIMKTLTEVALFGASLCVLLLFFVGLSGCGSNGHTGDGVGISDPPSDVPPGDGPAQNQQHQPFVFEKVGTFIHGMPIHIEWLPTQKFLVATREGHVVLLNKDLQEISHDTIEVETYWDSGLVSLIPHPDYNTNHYVYAYFTKSDDGTCKSVFCNTVVRYTIDESSSNPLTDPQVMAVIPMVNLNGQHQGGGMAFGPGNYLYVAIGDGQFWDTIEATIAHDLSQDPNSDLGKVLRFNVNTFDYEVVASGLRNPFTAVRSPEGMLIGDVGFEHFEEVNLLSWDLDQNFGWPITEGNFDANEHPDFSEPLTAFAHCDEKYKDDDPFGHEGAKALTIKNHGGVEHPCGSEVVAAAGWYGVRTPGDQDPYQNQLSGTVIYTEAYYGWIRAFELVDGKAVNDRHIAHFPGLTSLTEGPGGYLYGVSIFEGNDHDGSYVFRLRLNEEAQ